MKPKISPEEYRKILESLELENLQLTEINAKFKDQHISSALELSIDEKYTFEQEETELKVFYNYKLIASEQEKEVPEISLQAKYTVKYKIARGITVSKDFMRIFSKLTLGMFLWTYFRELVSNTIYRMGMPPLVLPLKKH